LDIDDNFQIEVGIIDIQLI